MKAIRAFSVGAARNLSGGVAFIRQVGAVFWTRSLDRVRPQALAKDNSRLYLYLSMWSAL